MASEAFDIMEQLLDVDESERETLLRSACEGDEGLMEEVRALLAIDAQASGFLEPGTGLLGGPAPETTPTQIGPYHIERRVGEGGFGIVYRATQREPLERTVALKVIKPGMDSDAVLRRFELERQTLALIEHPNVARVLDGGIVPDGQPGAGRPYFAMEFVAGAPITEYAERRALGIQPRVELVLQACAAAQHAHAKGVIHRDLKPSNILVTEVDGRAMCKVIDFGIAKALGDDRPDVTKFTSPGAMVGTPQYMSPEQAMGSADIDIRSDVYSLGVVLYELLSGAPPFEVGSLRGADLDRLRRLISEFEPQPPSARISRAAGDQGSMVSSSSTARRVRGDLDWITMRAMAKEVGRRYATVAALADDLRRYLRSEPVEAGPPGVGYRVGKFVRRHRAGVVVAAGALALLVAGLAGTSYGLVAARRAQVDAAREAAIATAINDFLNEDLLGAADPTRAERRDVTVREVLGAASDNIEGRFAEEPMVEAGIRRTIAQLLERLGDPEQAESHRVRELEIQTEQHGPVSHGTLEAVQSLATNLMDQRRFAEAVPHMEGAIEILAARRGPDDPQRLRAVSNLGVALLQLGRLAEATPYVERSLEGKRRTLGEDDPSTLNSVHNLAGLHGSLGNHDRSLELARQAYEGRLRVLGPRDPKVFSSLNLLTWALTNAGELDEATQRLGEAIGQARALLGPEHPRAIALIDALADVHHMLGEHERAEQLLREVLPLYQATRGEDHPDTLDCWHSLAVSVSEQGRHDEAVSIYDDLFARASVVAEQAPLKQGQWMIARGDAQRRSGRFSDAERTLLACHELVVSSEDPGGLMRRRVIQSLVVLYNSWFNAEDDPARAEAADRWEAELDAP